MSETNKEAVIFLPICLLAAVFLPSFANVNAITNSPITTTISPSIADTYTTGAYPSTAHGSEANIFIWGYPVSSGQAFGFVKFDLSAIPFGSTVNSAELKLWETSGSGLNVAGNTLVINVYRIDASWDESLTWNTPRPAMESIPSDSEMFNMSIIGYKIWDVKSDVQAFVSEIATNYGWCLTTNYLAHGASFTSREGDSSQYPQLVVTYTPPLSIVAPSGITVEGNTLNGAKNVVLGTALASGGVSPYSFSNDAPSFFPLGSKQVTWTVTDVNGKTATAIQTVTVIDTTPPTITAPSALSVLVNSPNSLLKGTAQDIVDANPTLTNNAPNVFPPGLTTVTWTAEDTSHNISHFTTKVIATYSFSGFLPPISKDVNSNGFKQGSTIPLKFQLADYNGNFVFTASGTVSLKWISGVSPTNTQPQSYSTADDTNLRLAGNQYIFNLDTKTLSAPSVYQVTVNLDDGAAHSILISLK